MSSPHRSQSDPSKGTGVGRFFNGLLQFLQVVVMPLAVLWVGQEVSRSIRQQEIGAGFVDRAVQILNADVGQSPEGLRVWAVKVINLYSGVRIPEEAAEELISGRSFSPELGRFAVRAGTTVPVKIGELVVEVSFEDAASDQQLQNFRLTGPGGDLIETRAALRPGEGVALEHEGRHYRLVLERIRGRIAIFVLAGD